MVTPTSDVAGAFRHRRRGTSRGRSGQHGGRPTLPDALSWLPSAVGCCQGPIRDGRDGGPALVGVNLVLPVGAIPGGPGPKRRQWPSQLLDLAARGQAPCWYQRRSEAPRQRSSLSAHRRSRSAPYTPTPGSPLWACRRQGVGTGAGLDDVDAEGGVGSATERIW
jgi:hypothetical protein